MFQFLIYRSQLCHNKKQNKSQFVVIEFDRINPMRRKLINFFNKPTSRDIIVNTFGNYLNVFFTIFFVILLARLFSRPDMGVYSILFGISYVLANLLDFGTTATIYSYLPPLIESKAENLFRFIKSTFYYQSLFSLIVIILLFISFPYLDKHFFKTHAPTLVLYITTISVLFFIWQNFVLNILFAAKKFFKANLYLNLSNILKTVILFYLIFSKNLTVGSVIFVFGIVGPIIFFALLFIEKKDFVFILLKSEVKREEFRFSYALPNFIASQFFNLGLRMDLFLMSYFTSLGNVADYGLAQKIILVLLTTLISITQVLSPSFANIKTKSEIMHKIKHGLIYMALPTFLFFILFITPNFIFHLVLTDKYQQLPAVSRALALAFLIYPVVNIPMLFLLYTVKKPSYVLISNIIFFLIVSIGCYILIPKYGVFGPPYIIFGAFATQGIIMMFATVKEYLKIQKEELTVVS